MQLSCKSDNYKNKYVALVTRTSENILYKTVILTAFQHLLSKPNTDMSLIN